jgi:transposase
VKKQPDAQVYAQKKERLMELITLENDGKIDLFFTDECGFNLTPSIPYGWQPIGETRTIRSAKDRVTNVFGLLSRSGKLKAYTTPQNINSDFIIECVDEVALTIEKPTVLIFDNAPWHTSNKVLMMQKEWEQKKLYIFFLPTYSPHLNLIETLWRKIKYEWLRPEHYESAGILKDAIFNIIRKYDDEFSINFSKNFNL